VYIEIRDPKVAEFFRNVLKEGQPADEIVRLLIEDPCKAKRALAVSKYEERISSVFADIISSLSAYIDYVVAKRVAEAVNVASDVVKNDSVEREYGNVVSCNGKHENRRKCLEDVMEDAGGCMKYSEIEKVYGKRLNSKLLEKWGFVRRGKGVWCLPKTSKNRKRAKA